MACPFKNILGKPGEGIHKYRMFGMALIDWVATIIAAILISLKFEKPFLYVFIGLFILGELLHWAFCVDTPIIRFFTQTVRE